MSIDFSELRERPDHLHHHSTRWCSRVDRFRQATKSRPCFPDPIHNREYVAKGPRQPIEFPHHEHVTLAKLVEQPVKLGTIPTSTRRLLPKDALAPGSLQRLPLGPWCPDRRSKLWRSRSALLKCIANRISSAIPFCNARSPVNQLLSNCCETGRLCNHCCTASRNAGRLIVLYCFQVSDSNQEEELSLVQFRSAGRSC